MTIALLLLFLSSSTAIPGRLLKTADPAQDMLVKQIIALVVLLLTIIGIVFLVYCLLKCYMKIRHRQVAQQYALDPESLMPRQTLGMMEKIQLRSWDFNKTDIVTKNVKVEKIVSDLGEHHELIFNQRKNAVRAVLGTMPIGEGSNGQTQTYFEVELHQYKDRNCIVTIGLSTKENFASDSFPGEYPNSFGVQGIQGKVFSMRQYKFDLEFNCQYGETMGIGWDKKTKRVYITYNGTLINQPTSTELAESQNKGIFGAGGLCCGCFGGGGDSKEDEDKKKEEEEKKKKEEEAKKGKRFEQLRLFDEKMAKLRVTIAPEAKLYPVISSNGPCTLNVNVGGTRFRYYQPEIKFGML